MKGFLHNKNFKTLLITLVILVVMSVLSLADNSVVSSAVNGITKGLFQVSARQRKHRHRKLRRLKKRKRRAQKGKPPSCEVSLLTTMKLKAKTTGCGSTTI